MDSQLIPSIQILGVAVLLHSSQDDIIRGASGHVDVVANPRSVISVTAAVHMIFIPFLPFSSIKAVRLGRRVPCLNLSPLPYLPCVNASYQHRKRITNLYPGISSTNIFRASSGASSPQSTITSIIFSSTGSSPSRSPPSSQNSFTDRNPFPTVLVRRQPRIQVSSLLADSFTRFV